MKRYHDQERCAHCGEIARGYARLDCGERVCHGEAGPDCYRRVTVYAEPLGILAGLQEMPPGITAIRAVPGPDVTFVSGGGSSLDTWDF